MVYFPLLNLRQISTGENSRFIKTSLFFFLYVDVLPNGEEGRTSETFVFILTKISEVSIKLTHVSVKIRLILVCLRLALIGLVYDRLYVEAER